MTTRASTRPPATRPRRSRFERLADWAYSHRRRALLTWVAVFVGVTAASSVVGSDYHNDFSLLGTESQQAVDTLARAPAQARETVQVPLQDPDGLRAPAVRRVDAFLTEVRRLADVAGARGPYGDASALSRNGTMGYATVALDGWLYRYNHHRRHRAIGRQPPVNRLNNLLRTYT